MKKQKKCLTKAFFLCYINTRADRNGLILSCQKRKFRHALDILRDWKEEVKLYVRYY